MKEEFKIVTAPEDVEKCLALATKLVTSVKKLYGKETNAEMMLRLVNVYESSMNAFQELEGIKEGQAFDDADETEYLTEMALV